MRKYALVLLVATTCSTLVLGRYLLESASWGRVPENVPTYVPEFAGSEGAFNVLAARGDAQGFAILYWDPALRRGSEAGNEETAYRANRPLLSYLAWLLMAGRRGLAAQGVFLVTWLSAIAAAAAVAALARSRGLSVWWGLLGALLPGAIAAIPAGGADLLALGLAAFGLILWPRQPTAAVMMMTLGALGRETALVVPAGIIIHGIVMQRRLHLGMTVPFAAWLGWAAVVHARYGAWPWEASAGDRIGFELSTLVTDPTGALNAALLIFLVYVGLRTARSDVLPWIALCCTGFLFVLGPDVLKSWTDFARVLLPGYVSGILAVAYARRTRTTCAPDE